MCYLNSILTSVQYIWDLGYYNQNKCQVYVCSAGKEITNSLCSCDYFTFQKDYYYKSFLINFRKNKSGINSVEW